MSTMVASVKSSAPASMSSLARFLRQHWGKLPAAASTIRHELIGVKRAGPAQGDKQGAQKKQDTKAEEERITFEDLTGDTLGLLTQWLSLEDVKNLTLASGAFRKALDTRRVMLGQRFRLHITAATFNRARNHPWLSFLVKISTDTWWVLRWLAQLGPAVSDVVYTPVAGDRFVLREVMPQAPWQLQKLTIDFGNAHFHGLVYTVDFEGAAFPTITELRLFSNPNDDADEDSLPDGTQYITAENFPNLRHLTVWNAGLDFGSIRWLPPTLETAKLWISVTDVGEFSKATQLTLLRELTLHISLKLIAPDWDDDLMPPQPFDTLKTLVGLRVLELGGFSIPNVWYRELPDGLTSLTIAENAERDDPVNNTTLFDTTDAVPRLPRNLQELRIYTDSWESPMWEMPPRLVRLEIISNRFRHRVDGQLPATLRHLVIHDGFDANMIDSVDCALIPNIETIDLGGSIYDVTNVRKAPKLQSLIINQSKISF